MAGVNVAGIDVRVGFGLLLGCGGGAVPTPSTRSASSTRVILVISF
jgi:hypothetical protein